MTLSEFRAVERALERMLRWDGDGQLVDHGAHGAFNDRQRATRRAIRRGWLSMAVAAARALVRSVVGGA